MRRIIVIVRKELLQLRRDRRMFPILFVAPVIQLVLLGYAATTDLRDAPVVVCDLDQSAESRELLRSFSSSGDFLLKYHVQRITQVDRYLDGTMAEIGIVIPAGFGARVARGAGDKVQILVDGSRVNATIAMNQMSAAIAAHARDLMIERRIAAGVVFPLPVVEAEIRVWYNPGLTSRNFMVPAVLALILLVITTIVTSMSVVKEKEGGTIEQLIVTPIRPYQLIIGKLVPFAIIGFIEVLLVLSVAVLWFQVPLRGSAALLLSLCALFMLTGQGLGLFVSTVSHTQQQAMMTAAFFVIMPMVLLSGFVFPIEDMPRPVQWLTYVMPLRYFLVILRGVFLKGVGLEVLWPQVAALFGFGVTIITLASLRFQKRIG
jgi:ABC-2 type transport system permease protein